MRRLYVQMLFGVLALLAALIAIPTLFTSDSVEAETVETIELINGSLSEGELTDLALSWARDWGFMGDVLEQHTYSLEMGQWHETFDRPEARENPRRPVFVLVIRGQVEWQGFGGHALPDDPAVRALVAPPVGAALPFEDGMTVAIDGITGGPVMIKRGVTTTFTPPTAADYASLERGLEMQFDVPASPHSNEMPPIPGTPYILP